MKIVLTYLRNICFCVFLLPSIIYADIIPTPKRVNYQQGEYIIPDAVSMALIDDYYAENLFAAEIINQALKINMGVNSGLALDSKKANVLISFLDTTDVEKFKIPKNKMQEAYRLVITPNKIYIQGFEPKGIFYGAMSLAQLIEQNKDKKIPAQEVLDWSDMDIRGVSDDISRGQVSTLENFKSIISKLARYKINTYLLYIEDMLELEKYPVIGYERDALNAEQVSEIIEYAKKHFVEVIPIFETLGHQENILSLEQFQEISEFPGATSFCTSCPNTYNFLDDAIGEISKMFPSPYIHIGADESFDVGKGKSKKQAEELGIAKVHLNHYLKVYEICKKYNKKVIMYGDMLLKYPEIISQLPKDVMVVNWNYTPQAEYPSNKIFADSSLKYCVSPSVWNFQTVFPLHLYSLPNIEQLLQSGFEHDASGMINANWGDMGAETFKELLYLSYAWSGQCAWNKQHTDFKDFSSSFFYSFFGTGTNTARNVYQTLSLPENNVVWSEFWRHPLLPFKPNPAWHPNISPEIKANHLEWSMKDVSKDLDTLAKVILRNQKHIDVLKLVVNINQYYAFKLNSQLVLQKHFQNIQKDDDTLKSQDIDTLVALINKNIRKLENLKEQYQTLWKQYYEPQGLQHISYKFDRLIAYFEEIKEDLTEENTLKNPLIKSKWIYNCDEEDNCTKQAVFRYEFEIKNVIPGLAIMQLMADSYAELFVNGEPVDKVYIRNFFSAHLESQTIKTFNIRDLLKIGTNTIVIKAENYNAGLKEFGIPLRNTAGINAIIYFNDGGLEIFHYSDKSWWSSNRVEDPIRRTATPKPYPYEILTPNFLNERSSWVEK